MESLKAQVRRLKISTIPGKDVDVAVSLIKSTYKILSGASTSEHSFVPDDFNHTVIKVFQTTSVREFNANFKEIERKVLSQADMSGMAQNLISGGSYRGQIVNLEGLEDTFN